MKRNKKPPFGGKKSTIKLISSFMKLAEDFTKMPSLNMMSGDVDASLLRVLPR